MNRDYFFSLRTRITLIVIAVVSITTLVYVYSYDVVLGDDELWYTYVMDTSRTGHYYDFIDSQSRKVQTVDDVIESQIDHYNGVGGRVIVHSIEQYFTGVSSPAVFYVLNAIVLILTILCIVYIGTKGRLTSLYPWLIVIAVLLYMLDETPRPLTSINRAPNYLWPMLTCSIFLIVWGRASRLTFGHTTRSRIEAVLVAVGFTLMGLICGCTHEGYTIPLSGALFFYYLFNRREIFSLRTWLVIGLWIGTLIILVAPGNYNRMTLNPDSDITFQITNFLRLTPLYIFLVSTALLYIYNKERLTKFFSENRYLVLLFVLSAIFCTLIYGPRVDTPLYYFMLILLLRQYSWICGSRSSRWGAYIWVAAMAVIIIHWCLIVRVQCHDNKAIREMIEAYETSPDGVVIDLCEEAPDLVSPYLRRSFSLHPAGIEAEYTLRHGEAKKLKIITDADYKLISDADNQLDEQNRLPGVTAFHTSDGCKYAWAMVEDVRPYLDDEKIKVKYAPVSFNDQGNVLVKCFRCLFPERYPREDVIRIHPISTRWGDYYFFPLGSTFTPIYYEY